MFSPQTVDKVSRERLVFAVRPGTPLPWEPEHELAGRRLRPNQAWQHVVYLGVYRLDAVFEVLSRVFPTDHESFDERPPGESALAAFVVGEDGRALIGSEVLSSCAWATGQVERRGADGLTGFGEASAAFSEAWQDLVTDDLGLSGEDGHPRQVLEPRTLDHDDLGDSRVLAAAVTGTGALLDAAEIRISSRIVARRTADNPSGHDFLNSFIMADLERVADQLDQGDIGAALREYLRPAAEIDTSRRVDVRADLGAVLAATAPAEVPAGRWPSHPDHALALNQQLAVATATRTSPAPVLGVNGPPGTGKTTMLRDHIAALVVERAGRLSELAAPRAAFTGERLSWRTGAYKRVVHVLRPDLTGFEMVVASANNGAVQNVTDEIPAADAIDDRWREPAVATDYFPEIATALLAPEPDAEKPDAVPAWALVAARLGNKANRGRFVTTFWYHKPDEDDGEDVWHGLHAVVKGYEETPPDRPWSAAVEDYRAVERREAAVRARRAQVHQVFERRERIEAELADLRVAVVEAETRIDRARERQAAAVDVERLRTAEAEAAAHALRVSAEQAAREHRRAAERSAEWWQGELARRQQGLDWHRRNRPTFWDNLRTFGAESRRWAEEDRQWSDDVREAHGRLAAAHTVAPLPSPGVPPTPAPLVAARREVALAEQALGEAVRWKQERHVLLLAGEEDLVAVHAVLDHAAADLGTHYPDAEWWVDRDRRELAALWTDREWNEARTELFLAALALHKAFLRHVPTEMRQNLQAAMDLVGGEAPNDLPEDSALAAWQNLFFVVPVVSTTFASYARLFGHLGREALGWLLVDEAGQATPQNAVGALWRTRHSMVVGDPLQLEPVTTLPFRAEQAIREDAGVDRQWSSSRTSVQRLADRLTTLGTWLPDGEDKTWVGVPLTVHRRCDQPMFSVVNTIAYDGLMIDGTGAGAGERFREAYPTLPASKWIDVASASAEGHWIPEEGRTLDRILDALADLRFDMSEVMVIGPFRDIARQVKSRTRRHPGLVAGTIHTAQGKQADVVVLVLGSAPGSVGARKWAASKPNLLNVAVSRAKRRLYVIGDRRAWSKEQYFDVLADRLPNSPNLPKPDSPKWQSRT